MSDNLRDEATLISKIILGSSCLLASVAAGAIWLFDFSGKPLSRISLFWAMPLLCPVSFLVYLRSKIAGLVMQTALYLLAVTGAYQVVQEECFRGNCFTQNILAITVAAMFAGFHLIAMLAVLVLMGSATLPRPSCRRSA